MFTGLMKPITKRTNIFKIKRMLSNKNHCKME